MNGIAPEPLGRHAAVFMGQSPPSSAYSENRDHGLPFIQGNAEFGSRHPIPRLHCSVPTRVADPGDLLLSVRAPVGEVNQVDTPIIIGRGLSAVRVDPKISAFLWHALKWAAPQLNRVAQGSTFVAVSRSDVESLLIPWGNTKTCARIALVLDAIDATIAQTEAVIAKLKQMRTGLLRDLLTCGIDEHGQVRPAYTEAPHLYQDSPIGNIPREWRIGNISSISVNRDSCRVPLKQADRDTRSGIYPYYGASGIIDFIDDYLFDGQFVLIGEDGENLRSRQLPLAFIATGKFWVNNHAHILAPTSGTDVRFLAILLEAQDYIPWLLGSAQPKLTQRNLEQVPLRIPTLREQTIISDRLSALDKQIATESTDAHKQRLIKSGLMADLLSGRVPVPDTLNLVESYP